MRLISVSVDGLEDTHDRLRAVKGSYRAALDAITHVKDADIVPAANTQIGAQNLHEIEDLFEILADRGIKHWQIQVTVAMGRAADDPTLLLEPFQMLEVLAILHRLKPRAQARGIKIWPGNNVGYFGPYESEIRDMYPTGHMYSCGAGRSSMGIEANGAIKGCPSLPTKDYVGGNVRDYSLKDVWQRSEQLRFTRDRTVEKDLWGFCRDCYYADSCRAGCSWTSHVLFGRPGNQPFCHHRAIELLKTGKRERVVRTKEAPGTPFDAGEFEIVVEEWPADERQAALALVESGEGRLLPHGPR
jgi:radical SAM protein with 4Fe4S-binding SPASM domain